MAAATGDVAVAIDESGNKNNVLTAPPVATPAPGELSDIIETSPAVVRENDQCFTTQSPDIAAEADFTSFTTPILTNNPVTQLKADTNCLREQTHTPAPQVAAVASEVADSARLLDPEEPENPVPDEEAGKIGLRRLSQTPIPYVANTAAEVADTARLLDKEGEDKQDNIPDDEAGKLGLRRLSQTPLPEISQTAAEVADTAAVLDAQDANGTNSNREAGPVVIIAPETRRMATLHERTDSKFDVALAEEADDTPPTKDALVPDLKASGVDPEEDPEVISKEEEELATLKAKKAKKRTANQKRRLKELEERAVKRAERLAAKEAEPSTPPADPARIIEEEPGVEPPVAVAEPEPKTEEVVMKTVDDTADEPPSTEETLVQEHKDDDLKPPRSVEAPESQSATEASNPAGTKEGKGGAPVAVPEAIPVQVDVPVEDTMEDITEPTLSEVTIGSTMDPIAEATSDMPEPDTNAPEPEVVDKQQIEEDLATESTERSGVEMDEDIEEVSPDKGVEDKALGSASASIQPDPTVTELAKTEPLPEETSAGSVTDTKNVKEVGVDTQEDAEPSAQEVKHDIPVTKESAIESEPEEPRTEHEPALAQVVEELARSTDEAQLEAPITSNSSKPEEHVAHGSSFASEELATSPAEAETLKEATSPAETETLKEAMESVEAEENSQDYSPAEEPSSDQTLLGAEGTIETAIVPVEKADEPVQVPTPVEVGDSQVASMSEAPKRPDEPTAEEPNTVELPQAVDTPAQLEDVTTVEELEVSKAMDDSNRASAVPVETHPVQIEAEGSEVPEEPIVSFGTENPKEVETESTKEPEIPKEQPEAATLSDDTTPDLGLSVEPQAVEPLDESKVGKEADVATATTEASNDLESAETPILTETSKETDVIKSASPPKETHATQGLESHIIPGEVEPAKEPEPEAATEPKSAQPQEAEDAQQSRTVDIPLEDTRLKDFAPVEAATKAEESAAFQVVAGLEPTKEVPAEPESISFPIESSPVQAGASAELLSTTVDTAKETSSVPMDIEEPTKPIKEEGQVSKQIVEESKKPEQAGKSPLAVPLAAGGVALVGTAAVAVAAVMSKDELSHDAAKEVQRSERTKPTVTEATGRSGQLLTQEVEPVEEDQSGPSKRVEALRDDTTDCKPKTVSTGVGAAEATGADAGLVSEMRQRKGKEPDISDTVSASTTAAAEANQERSLAPPSVHHKKGFFNTFFRALFVDWIGGFLSKCFGGAAK